MTLEIEHEGNTIKILEGMKVYVDKVLSEEKGEIVLYNAKMHNGYNPDIMDIYVVRNINGELKLIKE